MARKIVYESKHGFVHASLIELLDELRSFPPMRRAKIMPHLQSFDDGGFTPRIIYEEIRELAGDYE